MIFIIRGQQMAPIGVFSVNKLLVGVLPDRICPQYEDTLNDPFFIKNYLEVKQSTQTGRIPLAFVRDVETIRQYEDQILFSVSFGHENRVHRMIYIPSAKTAKV